MESLYDCTGHLLVNPRDIAQRVMEIRSQIAKEWIEELKLVSEENSLLMRETLTSSFSLDNVTAAKPSFDDGPVHPEMLPDDSAAGSDD